MKALKTVAILALVLLVGLGGRALFLAPSETPTLGGPFTLVNSAGETVTQADFAGRHMLIYFGYTYCPDICPTSLQTVALALNSLPDSQQDKIVPLFITVDPRRDTPELVGDYAGFFHPRIIGLSGSQEQIDAVVRAYRVYANRVDEAGRPAPEDSLEYLVDHSSVLYLMGPDGTFIRHFSHGISPQDLAEGLAQL